MVIPASADLCSDALWKNRVLVIISPTASDVRRKNQWRIYQQAWGGMAERDVILVEVIGKDAISGIDRQRFGVISNNFRVLLVEKDGHAAMSSIEPLRLEQLFRAIDVMPMRQNEIRRRF